MNYGLPYMGSKNKIADWILENLPEADNFYDLFGGGGAITHKISNKSYDEFNITGDAVIYCDIPYKNTAGYNSGDFDYEKFYNWCEKQTVPVYISEYYMPEDRFEIVAEKTLKRKLSGVKNSVCNEKLFKVKNK